MNTVKTTVRQWKGVQRGLNMPLNFRLLTVVTSTGPRWDVAFHIGPEIPFGRREDLMPGFDKDCRLSKRARRIGKVREDEGDLGRRRKKKCFRSAEWGLVQASREQKK